MNTRAAVGKQGNLMSSGFGGGASLSSALALKPRCVPSPTMHCCDAGNEPHGLQVKASSKSMSSSRFHNHHACSHVVLLTKRSPCLRYISSWSATNAVNVRGRETSEVSNSNMSANVKNTCTTKQARNQLRTATIGIASVPLSRIGINSQPRCRTAAETVGKNCMSASTP